MAIIEEQPTARPTGLAALIDRSIRRVRIAGWVLTLSWLTLFVIVVVVCDRPTSYAQLERGLRAGDVSTVELPSTMQSSDGQGSEHVEVRWRDGLVLRTATLTRATDERSAREASRNGTSRPVIVGSVEDHLTALDPDLRVVHGDRRRPSFESFGWRGPGWVGLAYLVLLVGTLMLIAGPRPWRATRWACAWLVLLAPPVGIPCYLLLGGPTGLSRPRPPGRIWLTGGWAFLLALLLGGTTIG